MIITQHNGTEWISVEDGKPRPATQYEIDLIESPGLTELFPPEPPPNMRPGELAGPLPSADKFLPPPITFVAAASKEVIQERKAVCMGTTETKPCEYFLDNRCSEANCKCGFSGWVATEAMKCPKGKWLR